MRLMLISYGYASVEAINNPGCSLLPPTQLRAGDPFCHPPSIFMKKLTAEQFREYAADPLGADEKVRQWCDVPENRYYTVAMWPAERAGELRVTTELHRVVRAPKISKSDQAK
jgi:hypothetical protein